MSVRESPGLVVRRLGFESLVPFSQTTQFHLLWASLSHLYSEDVGAEKYFSTMAAYWNYLESFF